MPICHSIVTQALREYIEERYQGPPFPMRNGEVYIALNDDHLEISSPIEHGPLSFCITISYANPKLFELLDQYVPGYISIWGGRPLIKPSVELQAAE